MGKLPSKTFCGECGEYIPAPTELRLEDAQVSQDVFQGVKHTVYTITCDDCLSTAPPPSNPHPSTPASQRQFHSGLGEDKW